MGAGTNLDIKCPNAMSNSSVAASSETVTCAANPAPTTTTVPVTTTTVPVTTTTVPVTTTTVPATGGTCTSPTFTTSAATGTKVTDPNDGHEYWWVNNDEWNGSHGPQTLSVCSQSSWYAVSNQTDNGGAVETYPDTEYDIGGRATPSTTPISAANQIASTFSEAFPTDGSMDAAYDLWTDTYKNETMIWNQWSGDNNYWGNKAAASGIPVTLDGVAYHFLCQGSASACAPDTTYHPGTARPLEIFFRDTQTAAGSVNILAAWQWEAANGYASPQDIPTQVEYGAEVIATVGAETFPLNGLTVTAS
jgi:hypothetical protein